MRTKILAFVIAGLFGGALHASTVISCGWDTTALNNCMSGGLANFQTKLDWAAFGTPDGAVHTGLWTANTGGMNISVSTIGTGSGEGSRSAYVFDAVKVGGVWTDPGLAPFATPYAFPGNFNSITDSQPPSPEAPDSPYGDHLMGLRGNGDTSVPATSRQLLIDFGQTLGKVGFRIASNSDFSFNATVQFFGGANGTNPIGTWHFNSLTGGGVCNTLSINAANPPIPCNTAPFIAAMGINARGMSISTSDVDGFWIGDIHTAPEPSAMIFAGCGLGLLYLGRKKFKRA